MTINCGLRAFELRKIIYELSQGKLPSQDKIEAVLKQALALVDHPDSKRFHEDFEEIKKTLVALKSQITTSQSKDYQNLHQRINLLFHKISKEHVEALNQQVVSLGSGDFKRTIDQILEDIKACSKIFHELNIESELAQLRTAIQNYSSTSSSSTPERYKIVRMQMQKVWQTAFPSLGSNAHRLQGVIASLKPSSTAEQINTAVQEINQILAQHHFRGNLFLQRFKAFSDLLTQVSGLSAGQVKELQERSQKLCTDIFNHQLQELNTRINSLENEVTGERLNQSILLLSSSLTICPAAHKEGMVQIQGVLEGMIGLSNTACKEKCKELKAHMKTIWSALHAHLLDESDDDEEMPQPEQKRQAERSILDPPELEQLDWDNPEHYEIHSNWLVTKNAMAFFYRYPQASYMLLQSFINYIDSEVFEQISQKIADRDVLIFQKSGLIKMLVVEAIRHPQRQPELLVPFKNEMAALPLAQFEDPKVAEALILGELPDRQLQEQFNRLVAKIAEQVTIPENGFLHVVKELLESDNKNRHLWEVTYRLIELDSNPNTIFNPEGHDYIPYSRLENFTPILSYIDDSATRDEVIMMLLMFFLQGRNNDAVVPTLIAQIDSPENVLKAYVLFAAWSCNHKKFKALRDSLEGSPSRFLTLVTRDLLGQAPAFAIQFAKQIIVNADNRRFVLATLAAIFLTNNMNNLVKELFKETSFGDRMEVIEHLLKLPEQHGDLIDLVLSFRDGSLRDVLFNGFRKNGPMLVRFLSRLSIEERRQQRAIIFPILIEQPLDQVVTTFEEFASNELARFFEYLFYKNEREALKVVNLLQNEGSKIDVMTVILGRWQLDELPKVMVKLCNSAGFESVKSAIKRLESDRRDDLLKMLIDVLLDSSEESEDLTNLQKAYELWGECSVPDEEFLAEILKKAIDFNQLEFAKDILIFIDDAKIKAGIAHILCRAYIKDHQFSEASHLLIDVEDELPKTHERLLALMDREITDYVQTLISSNEFERAASLLRFMTNEDKEAAVREAIESARKTQASRA